jgi:hypothetical protein
MVTTSGQFLRWSPRILGILVSLFVGLFALDAFGEGKPLVEALAHFAIHLLPAVVLLAAVGASWNRPWVGGVTFVGLGIAYALTVAPIHLDWIVVVSGPLVVVGAIFIWSWLHGAPHQSQPAGPRR